SVELDLDIDKETDFVALAQIHANSNATNRSKLDHMLVTEFSAKVKPTDIHKILARLPLQTYWAAESDWLIETALEDNEKV
ncbi:hypothetical protein VSS95_30310, partial [Pseudomonas syringae pv. tagetis]